MYFNQVFKNFKGKFNLAFDPGEKKNLLKVLILMIFGSFLELCGIGLIIPLIKVFTDKEFLNSIYNIIGITPIDINFLIFISISFFLLFFLSKNFYLWFILKKYSFFFSNYEANLQTKLFNGYLKNSVTFFKENNSSQIVTNIISISSFFSSVYLNALINVTLDIIMLILILILLLYFSWQSTILIFVVFGSLVFLLYRSSKKQLFEIGKTRNKFSAIQLANVQEAIKGIKEIKLTGRENFFSEQFIKTTSILANATYKNAVISGTPRLFVEFISVASIASIVFFLTSLGKTFNEILPILGLFLAAAYKMIPTLNKILLMFNRLKFSGDAVNKIIDLLDSFKNYENHNFQKFNSQRKIDFKNLSIKNLHFTYEKRNKIILENVNINIKKNSFIGIKGESGTGKSTLVDLLMGVLSPTSGQIYIDDVPLSEIINDWQYSIGYVDQNIFLLPGNIIKNIAFGIPDEKVDMQLIREVVEKSALKKFVDNLDNGLNTNIGEGGAMISGGQRQRIGIARALYNRPKILIFDEATSALDIETENEILNEVNQLKNEITMISISHRNSTVRHCDVIFNLKDGSLTSYNNF
jgi:ABC-type multidrug transport system fused ATPase/permease subunit